MLQGLGDRVKIGDMFQRVRPNRLLLLLACYLAFALRLLDLSKQNIWWDEARNIDVALRPFWQIPVSYTHLAIYFSVGLWGSK